MEFAASSTSLILPSTKAAISKLTHSKHIMAIPGRPNFKNCHQSLKLSQLHPKKQMFLTLH